MEMADRFARVVRCLAVPWLLRMTGTGLSATFEMQPPWLVGRGRGRGRGRDRDRDRDRGPLRCCVPHAVVLIHGLPNCLPSPVVQRGIPKVIHLKPLDIIPSLLFVAVNSVSAATIQVP